MDFLTHVYADSRADELASIPWSDEQKIVFLRSQSSAQHGHYQKHFPGIDFDLVIQNDVPIGRLYVWRTPTSIRVVDITLLREHQQRGIGRTLMTALLAEAAEAGKSVEVSVSTLNSRAIRFYLQLGFVQTGVHGAHHSMKWCNDIVCQNAFAGDFPRDGQGDKA